MPKNKVFGQAGGGYHQAKITSVIIGNLLKIKNIIKGK